MQLKITALVTEPEEQGTWMDPSDFSLKTRSSASFAREQ